MKNLIIALLLALAPLAGAAQQNQDEEIIRTTIVRRGDTAPDFSVTLTDGRTVSLSDLRGKVVLLNFWATWCGPCRQEMKNLPGLLARFRGQDFVLLPVSRGEKEATVVRFLKDNGYDFPAGLDPESAVYGKYATQYVPRNFLIDRTGRVVSVGVGYSPEEFAALVKTIEETLKK